MLGENAPAISEPDDDTELKEEEDAEKADGADELLVEISELVLTVAESEALDEASTARAWATAKDLSRRTRIQVFSVLAGVALAAAAIRTPGLSTPVQVVLVAVAVFVASSLGTAVLMYPFALPLVLVRQRDEAREATRRLRRQIASDHGLFAARNELDTLVRHLLERAAKIKQLEPTARRKELASIRTALDAHLARPVWAGMRDRLTDGVTWPSTADLGAPGEGGQKRVEQALKAIGRKLDWNVQPWKGLFRS
jgi:hypothetical protein